MKILINMNLAIYSLKCIDEAKKVIYHKLNVLNTIGKANLYK